MTADPEQQARPIDSAEDIALPTQRRPPDSAERRVDHVRAHGRSCWWDHTECRWTCTPDR